jgi:hypothetical protein
MPRETYVYIYTRIPGLTVILLEVCIHGREGSDDIVALYTRPLDITGCLPCIPFPFVADQWKGWLHSFLLYSTTIFFRVRELEPLFLCTVQLGEAVQVIFNGLWEEEGVLVHIGTILIHSLPLTITHFLGWCYTFSELSRLLFYIFVPLSTKSMLFLLRSSFSNA